MATLAARRFLPKLPTTASQLANPKTLLNLSRAMSTRPPLDDEPLYPTHIRTSPLQRPLLTLGAAVGALLSPARADLVATLVNESQNPQTKAKNAGTKTRPLACSFSDAFPLQTLRTEGTSFIVGRSLLSNSSSLPLSPSLLRSLYNLHERTRDIVLY
jgi:hypothetical protein